MKKRKVFLISLISLVVICVLASVVFLLFRFKSASTTRPLVLIHAPRNQDAVWVGKGLIVHATADDPTGLERIELWVDNLMIASKVIDQTETLPKLVLSTSWVPFHSGEHILIVRAVSTAGKTGLASIVVEAIEEEPGGWVAHVVSAGETLEDAADQYGISAQEILDLNTGLDPEGLAAGDQIFFPEALVFVDGDANAEGDQIFLPEVPATGNGDADIDADANADETVDPDTEEEGIDSSSIVSSDGRSGYLRRADEMTMLASPTDQAPAAVIALNPVWMQLFDLLPDNSLVELRIEVLSLETQDPYEMLHCYASLADRAPMWVPDTDFNQSTDESFTPIGVGGMNWDIAQYMANTNATSINWIADQSIPFSIRCVGILAGGTESVNLGNIQDSIEPARWGPPQYAISSDGESRFSLSYKVSRPTKGPDETIPIPQNVRINAADQKLLWDYLPEDRNRIHGFAILLNDTLQLTEHRSMSETTIPEQWLNIPCGDEYNFQVIAFRNAYPDGDYSLPSNSAIVRGGEFGDPSCGRTVVVTFETLSVGELGGNPRPVYGSFFANDLKLTFDGRPIGGNFGSPTFGLNQNSQYNVSELMEFGSYVNQLVVELPAGQPHISELLLWIGFDIYHDETLVCSGYAAPAEDQLTGFYRGRIQTNLPVGSSHERCVVNYSIQALGGAPVVDPGAPPPLPNLVVQNLIVGADSGRLFLAVRNLGPASWADKPINARVTWPNGDLFGVFEWPRMTINPSQTVLLSHADLDPHPALGVCVLLDPDNLVEEEDDRLVADGILPPRTPFCRPQPDLSIAKVTFNASTSDLHIELQNQGQEPSPYLQNSGGSLENQDLLFWIEFPDGRPITREFPGINMGYRETITLNWPINAIERERMRGGYTVVVNPDHRLSERDYTNNNYPVESNNRLRIVWRVGYATYCQVGRLTFAGNDLGPKNTWSMRLRVLLGGGGITQTVVDWNSPEIELHGYQIPQGDRWCTTNYISEWFDVAGDQVVTIIPTAYLKLGFLRQTLTYWGGVENLTAADDFGGTTHVPSTVSNSCLETGVAYASLYDFGQCGGDTCPGAGVRSLGRMEVTGENFYRPCWWTIGYTIFREDNQ